MKLLIVGQSHVGMLAAALRDRLVTGVTADLFACTGMDLSDVILDGPYLRANSSRLMLRLREFDLPSTVCVDDYDAVLIVGMNVSYFHAAFIKGDKRIWSWGERRRSAKDRFLSESALHEALRHIAMSNLSRAIVSTLRRVRDIPIFILSEPGLSERVLTPELERARFKRLALDGVGPYMFEAVCQAHERVYGEDRDVFFLRQPAQTLTHGFLTAEAYSRNSARLAGDSRGAKPDVLHANGQLGALYLREIARSMNAQPSAKTDASEDKIIGA